MTTFYPLRFARAGTTIRVRPAPPAPAGRTIGDVRDNTCIPCSAASPGHRDDRRNPPITSLLLRSPGSSWRSCVRMSANSFSVSGKGSTSVASPLASMAAMILSCPSLSPLICVAFRDLAPSPACGKRFRATFSRESGRRGAEPAELGRHSSLELIIRRCGSVRVPPRSSRRGREPCKLGMSCTSGRHARPRPDRVDRRSARRSALPPSGRARRPPTAGRHSMWSAR